MISSSVTREQGWRSGETALLLLNADRVRFWPVAICGLSLLLVLSLLPGFFSGYSGFLVFPPPQNSNSTRIEDPRAKTDVASSPYIEILKFLRHLHTKISKDFLKVISNVPNQNRPRHFLKMAEGCQQGSQCFRKF